MSRGIVRGTSILLVLLVILICLVLTLETVHGTPVVDINSNSGNYTLVITTAKGDWKYDHLEEPYARVYVRFTQIYRKQIQGI